MSKDYLGIPDDSAATKSIERSPFTSGRQSRIGMLQQDNNEFVNFSDEENAVTLSLDAFNISMKNGSRFRETTLNRTQRDKSTDVDEGSEYIRHEDNDTDEHNVSSADVCVDNVLQTECYSSDKDSTSGHASDNSLYEGDSESSGMGQDCEDDLTSYESEVFESDISETSPTPPYDVKDHPAQDAALLYTHRYQSENGCDLEKHVNTLSSNTTLKLDETVKINENRFLEVEKTPIDNREANVPDLETEDKTVRMQTCNTMLSEKHDHNTTREYNPNVRNKSTVQRKMLDTASNVKSRFIHSDSDTGSASSKQSIKRQQTYTSASQKQCNQVKANSSTKLSTNVIRHISELPVIEASQRRHRSRNNVKYESPDNKSNEKYTGRNKSEGQLNKLLFCPKLIMEHYLLKKEQSNIRRRLYMWRLIWDCR